MLNGRRDIDIVGVGQTDFRRLYLDKGVQHDKVLALLLRSRGADRFEHPVDGRVAAHRINDEVGGQRLATVDHDPADVRDTVALRRPVTSATAFAPRRTVTPGARAATAASAPSTTGLAR